MLAPTAARREGAVVQEQVRARARDHRGQLLQQQHTFWLSLYVLRIGLLLGAVWGTGRSLPIAGAGFTAVTWQENTARALISLGALGSAGAVVALLFQWKWVA